MPNNEPTPLNMKAVLRKMSELLPPPQQGQDESWLVSLIWAVWSYSDTFIKAEDLEAGEVGFRAEVSYAQLGKTMRCSYAGARKRCEMARKRYPEIFQSERGQYSNKITVKLGERRGFLIEDEGNEYESAARRIEACVKRSLNEVFQPFFCSQCGKNEVAVEAMRCQQCMAIPRAKAAAATTSAYVRKSSTDPRQHDSRCNEFLGCSRSCSCWCHGEIDVRQSARLPAFTIIDD